MLNLRRKKTMKTMKKILAFTLLFALILTVFAGCGEQKEKILIYTSSEDYAVEDMSKRLKEQFPNYDITLEYMSTGNHAAKLMAEQGSTKCDITYDLEYAYLSQLDEKGLLADLSHYDKSIYSEDTVESENYIIQCRNGGAIILNTETLKKKNLPEPTSYEDLLKPEYKGLISMPNPKSSGTGYMFVKSLVNAWGEKKALAYFDKLTENILQYTSSGSGPVNALMQGEAAIGLGMTSQAVMKINEGAPLKVVFFEEGAPFTLYGQAILKGKETRECVKEVFDFLINTYNLEQNEKFLPEQIYKDKTFTMKNYPENILYADMKNNTIEAKNKLLDQWKY